MMCEEAKKTTSLKDVAKILTNVESVLLFPHVNMDGDTFGSSVALCQGLRKLGKNAYIFIDEEIPVFLKFLGDECCTSDPDKVAEPDACICIDCGDPDRFKGRRDKFFTGKIKGCLDHHVSTVPFADFNLVDPEAAATGEIVFDVLKAMDIELDDKIGQALFTAITTDTGNFQYSSTTSKTHRIAAELYELDVDYDQVSVHIYQSVRPERIKLHSAILGAMEIFAEGRAAICGVTEAMLSETGGLMEETEGVVESLRSIRGVELAVFIKELGPEKCKISMRSKSWLNVADISIIYNGGGHDRAAGFTLFKGFEAAWAEMKKVATEKIEEKL